MKIIGEYAFAGCKGLSGSLKIPTGVTNIGQYAFDGCTGFSEVVISSSVTRIDADALYNLNKIVLKDVTLNQKYYINFYPMYRSDGTEIWELEADVTYNETITKEPPTVDPTPIVDPTPTPTPTPEVTPGFKKATLYINKGDKVSAGFDKAGVSGKVTYKSSNKKAATVDSKGKITAKGVGTAKITASFGGKKYICTVKVYNPTINGKSTVNKGKSITLTIKNGRGTTKWSTSNKKIATVDKNGKVKGKKKGKVVITAINNGKTVKKTITVK